MREIERNWVRERHWERERGRGRERLRVWKKIKRTKKGQNDNEEIKVDKNMMRKEGDRSIIQEILPRSAIGWKKNACEWISLFHVP